MNRYITCAIALAFSTVTVSVGAAPITHKVVVNPIQVKFVENPTITSHVGNPNRELFEAETNKILAQAGVVVEWLDWKEVVDNRLTLLGDVDENGNTGLGQIAAAGDPGAVAGVANMWFVVGMNSFGVASAGSGRMAVANGVFGDINTSGNDSLDTIAHEIAHILGLPHFTGATSNETTSNLMAQGGVRTRPDSINEIYPDGDGVDFLTTSQIATIQENNFGWLTPVPEPSSLALLGIAGLCLIRRRRN